MDIGGDPVWSGEGVGGGAIQLVSRVGITVRGFIRADGGGAGGDRYLQTNGFVLGGGGAGGAILLEAPEVTLASGAVLSVVGGDGIEACGQAGVTCTARGLGATSTRPASAGVTANCDPSGSMPTAAGSGGGGLGRIRVNTATGAYSKASDVLEDGAVSAGIAQMVIAKYEQIKWESVEVLDATDRGAGGFGHSGTK